MIERSRRRAGGRGRSPSEATFDRLEDRAVPSFGLDLGFGQGGLATVPALAGSTPANVTATGVVIDPSVSSIVVGGNWVVGGVPESGVIILNLNGTPGPPISPGSTVGLTPGETIGALYPTFLYGPNGPTSYELGYFQVGTEQGSGQFGVTTMNMLMFPNLNDGPGANQLLPLQVNPSDATTGTALVPDHQGVVLVGDDTTAGTIVAARVSHYPPYGAIGFGVEGPLTSIDTARSGGYPYIEQILVHGTAKAVAVQGTGGAEKLILAGEAPGGGAGHQLLLLRLDDGSANGGSDGGLDPTFGTAGTGEVLVDFGADAAITSVAVQPADGKIVVGGSVGGRPLLARFNADGTPDTGFGNDGRAVLPPGSTLGPITDVHIASDGKIVALGGATLARFDADGTVDLSFGPRGQVDVQAAARTPGLTLRRFTFEADGSIVAAGASGGDFDVIHLVKRAELAVFQPSTSTFDILGTGATQFGHGTLYGGDPVPVVNDYTGSGKAQVAVFQPSTATYDIQGVAPIQFGQGTLYGGDPIPVGGDSYLAAYRSLTAEVFLVGDAVPGLAVIAPSPGALPGRPPDIATALTIFLPPAAVRGRRAGALGTAWDLALGQVTRADS